MGGLDSHAAAKIFRILKDLSQRGVAVLATLHQPTDAMFLGFDSLLLLRDGEASYAGDPSRSISSIAPKPPPKGMPIADYLMEVICGDDAKQATSHVEATTGTISITEEAGPALPWLSQFIILLKRCFLAHRLDLVDPMLLANMFSVMLLSAALWSGQGSKRPRTETSVRDISGLLFLSPVYWAFQLMILALYTFPADRVVVTKERAAGVFDQRLLLSKDVRGHAYHRPHVASTFAHLLLCCWFKAIRGRLAFTDTVFKFIMCPLRGIMYWRVDHESETSDNFTDRLHAGDDDVRRILRARRADLAEVVRGPVVYKVCLWCFTEDRIQGRPLRLRRGEVHRAARE